MNTEGQTAPESAQNQQLDNESGEVVDPRDAMIAALTLERDGLKDQLLRTMAEAQNVQRRLRQSMEEDRKFAARPLVERLLPVLDSFERSLEAAQKGASFEALLDGVKVVDKQLRQALEAVHVERIASVGKPYDAEVHEALLSHVSEDHPEDTVTDEIESGYTMHGRVIRPAKVRVSKRP